MTESELQHRDYLSGVWTPSTTTTDAADFVLVALVVAVLLVVAAVCR